MESVRIKTMIKYCNLDVMRNNILGREGDDLISSISINMKKLVKFFFDVYWKMKVGNLVKRKRSKSSYERLSRFMRLDKVYQYISIAVFKVIFYRLFELRVKSFKLEFDDVEVIKDKKFDVEEEELKEKYEEVFSSSNGKGHQAIYYRYFENIGRKRIMELHLKGLVLELDFNQSEKFYSLFSCQETLLFLWSKETVDRLLVAKANQSRLSIKFPLKFNNTLAYINSSIKFILDEVDFYFNDETIELFLGFFWNIKLMNNIKSFAKKQKTDAYRVKKKSKADQINDIYEHIKKNYPGREAEYVRPDLVPAVREEKSKQKRSRKNLSFCSKNADGMSVSAESSTRAYPILTRSKTPKRYFHFFIFQGSRIRKIPDCIQN